MGIGAKIDQERKEIREYNEEKYEKYSEFIEELELIERKLKKEIISGKYSKDKLEEFSLILEVKSQIEDM